MSLTITPPAATEAEAGVLVGPFVVSTTASEVTLTPSAGVTVTDADGNPLASPVTDGTEFFLTSPAAGAGSVTATATATVHTGRVFVKQGSQRLILAAPVDAAIDAEAPASWTPAHDDQHHGAARDDATRADDHRPESTTTTAPPAESTTTTVSITPGPASSPPGAPVASTPTIVGTSGQLPRTGQDVARLDRAGARPPRRRAGPRRRRPPPELLIVG